MKPIRGDISTFFLMWQTAGTYTWDRIAEIENPSSLDFCRIGAMLVAWLEEDEDIGATNWVGRQSQSVDATSSDHREGAEVKFYLQPCWPRIEVVVGWDGDEVFDESWSEVAEFSVAEFQTMDRARIRSFFDAAQEMIPDESDNWEEDD